MTTKFILPKMTKDGRPVRIYATDGGKNAPIHGAYLSKGEWEIAEWEADGTIFDGHEGLNLSFAEVVKPCAFCGNNKIEVQFELGSYSMQCTECLATGPSTNDEETAKIEWANRSSL